MPSRLVSPRPARSPVYLATLLMTLVAGGGLDLLYLSGLQAGGFDAAGLLLGRDFLNLHFAGTLLGQGEMTTLFDQQAYAEAYAEWDVSGERAWWETTTGDGLDDAAR